MTPYPGDARRRATASCSIAAAPRPAHDPWRHQGAGRRGRARRGRRRRARRDGLPHRPRVPVALRDVRPLALHDRRRHAARRDPRPDRPPRATSCARAGSPPSRGIKLYNAGSFFDPRAVPGGRLRRDRRGARRVSTRVIVESHPALVGPRVDRLLAALDRASRAARRPALEVAMGLETAHPDALDRLNKRMTLDGLRARGRRALGSAASRCACSCSISPPFVPADEQDEWLLRSVDVAFACGASVVSLDPDAAGQRHHGGAGGRGRRSRAPTLDDLERSLRRSRLGRAARGRVFADLWDLERFADCRALPAPRGAQRLRAHEPRAARPAARRVRGCARGARMTPSRDQRIDADVAIVGSGFAGSLTALALRQRGRRVVLLERGRHPRFAIGESSTPLANLLLEELADRYDLPRIRAFSKWGTWQRDASRRRLRPEARLHASSSTSPARRSRTTPTHATPAAGRPRARTTRSPTRTGTGPTSITALVREAEREGAIYLDETRARAAAHRGRRASRSRGRATAARSA